MQISEGIMLINKPRGRSSFSMVAQVRRLSGIKKVGHAGTLDPEAEGLMIVLVGKEFTKQAANYSKLDKTYEFSLKLGENSRTDDEEGDKTIVSAKKPTSNQIKAILEQFTGEILQIPPSYSAIKVNGQRAYKLARAGKAPELKPRPIHIYELKLLDYTYPQVTLRASVSSGTYIRSLGRSIGESLGTGAYCTRILRTRVGDFDLAQATSLD